MKEIVRRNAGLFAALLGIILVLVVYTLLGTVDLVFMKGDFQVARTEDVRVISDLQIENVIEDVKIEELEFTYGEGKTYAADMTLRVEIAKTLVVNLFTQKWDAADQVIILEAK
jgi:hypothetical protein